MFLQNWEHVREVAVAPEHKSSLTEVTEDAVALETHII